MAGNATFESASTSSSEQVFSGSYLNGQRGGSVDRSGNYREGSESRMLGSGFAVPPLPPLRGGSSSVLASDEMHTLSQSISLEPIVIRNQIAWCDEVRRVLGISVGSAAEENSSRTSAVHVKAVSPMADLKDLKRFRLSVEDACVKARVRANRMDERLRKLDKYYEDLTSKKQKRNDLTSNDRAGALNLKMGTQIYSMNQRVEDRPKNILLNKRVRTSVAESRAKDGNLHEDNGGESVFEKIRRLAAGGEGWDKKGKRKRSTGPVSTRLIDDDGVPRRVVQNKVVVENGSQPHDAHIYRLNTRDDSLNSRKRPMPLGSSSPPMAAQWVGQRPQKMARARRPYLVSLVSNQDEKRISFESCSPPDVGARLTYKGTDGSPISRLATNGPKKLNVKLENVQSSPRLSESHESVGGQSRLTDKEVVYTITNATEKNKNNSLVNSATRKPYQSRKTGCKKNGSKPGRRLKKLSERKGFSHHSPLQSVSSPDCPGASDDDREEMLAAVNHARTASYLACSSPFWKKMEPVFAHVDSEDKSFLSQQVEPYLTVDSISDPHLSENGSFSRKLDVDKPSNESIPLFQRVLSALIIEDDVDTPEEGDARNMQFQSPVCVSSYDTHNLDDSSYENTTVVDKLLLELKSIGLCPDMLPVLEDEENETIQDEIDKLKTRLHQQEVKKKACLQKINNNIDMNSRVRDLETLAMDRLVEQAYRKLLSTRRSSRSGTHKVPKQAALAFGKRTLARCHKFENSGTSCFSEPPFHDILSTKLSSDEAFAINGPLSNRGRKKEVSLDDISTTKKQKTKPRQKTGQTPTPKNKSDNKHTGTTHPTGPSWLSTSNRNNNLVNDLDPLDEMEVGPDLGVPHDLNSFLNFDEQDPDVDFTAGLDIPMDDLTELF
ncbi:hypothetical protein M8C21_019987 [Ambrosia artemisiifolia]|uniref:Uncharacterized protein n=1 Tax=Ambrosia artemisiifolia TaxID=4212 RepID=A0AAD5BUT8_AMBAR|nr:hypothetical protein M8C21_019987 [Ambrosia artemisiifolia]